VKGLIEKSILLFALTISGCSSTQRDGKRNFSPAPYRLKIERPGQGAQLDRELAGLMLANKRIQAMRLCNDILFSSRSKQDRETANYWRTLLMAMEEIDEGNFPKAIDILEKGSKWWKSSTKEYHYKLIIVLLGKLKKQSVASSKAKKDLKSAKSSKKELLLLNQELSKELEEIKKKNEELEKLLEKLEKVK
jgi:hypothetical protein